MSDPVLISLIVSCSSLIGTFATLAVTVYIRRDVETVKVATNHMKDALVAAALKEGHAEGHKEGIKDERAATSIREGEAAILSATVVEVGQRVAEHDAWEREQKAK